MQIYGPENREDVLGQLELLMTEHSWEDIRVKARMIHNVIMNQNKIKEDEQDDLK
jgi:hypothetical protein